MMIDRFSETGKPTARAVEMTVIAQDPSVRDAHGRILRTALRVPLERLEPGPRGHRLRVVDYDASRGVLTPPFGHDDPTWRYWDHFSKADDERLRNDPDFLSQNAFAIAARTLATFESALGRRISWGFSSHQLFVVPRAFAEANAYYAGEDQALYFGYLPDPDAEEPRPDGSHIYTCLSHDIVAHETTHAVLDGLRPQFDEPGLPDQAAFHEAFADVVALLSVFSIGEVVEQALGEIDEQGRIPARQVEPEVLAGTVLFKVAEQLGRALDGRRGEAIRRSVSIKPTTAWRTDLAFEEPHRRGEILAAAMMQTLVRMWSHRLKALVADGGSVDRSRAAEEGSKSADHLLKMSIRAIDYCPPLEFEFEDFLDAVLTSDQDIAPDDEHGYRPTLRAAFGAFGIEQPAGRLIDLSRSSDRPVYQNLNYAALRSAPDEAFRFIWDNAAFFDINPAYHTRVEYIAPTVRVGPDGFVVAESVATYVQVLRGSVGDLERLSKAALEAPPGLSDRTMVQIYGGGCIVFDQFGGAKLHQSKQLLDWDRQGRRLKYLVRRGLTDTDGVYGSSLGTPRAQLFAEMHSQAARAEEQW